MAIEPERWQRIREIFEEAVVLDVEERVDLLDRHCDDDELRREVEELLQHHSDSMAKTASLGGVVGKAARDWAEEDLRSRDLVGRSVGHIRVQGLLGRGGMGEVYVGFDETLERRVALKAIHPRHRLSAESRARFLREARILSQLDHPNICRIFDYVEGGEDGDFLVLELIEGRQLGAAVEEGLESGQELDVALEIARALATAHAKGIVHRDLKPQNVMLHETGVTKVLDFGLAGSREGAVDEGEPAPGASHSSAEGESTQETGDGSRTRRGQILGTPLYMSPEQARGRAVGPASDMYSFGLLLQFLFTCESPRRSGELSVVLADARHGEIRELAGVDRDLASLIGELTSVEPALRPTARSTVERLRWIRDKPRRRLRRALASVAVLFVVLGVAKYTLDLRHARDRAELRRQQAEELIEFMIGDLRSKLAPVNRLAVLEDIGDQAIDYFEAVPAADLSPRELLLRSQALSQIGQVRFEAQDLDAALEAFEASLDLARELSKLDPANDERLTWLGAAHFWVGTVHFEQRRLDLAQASYEDYLEVSRELVERDPSSLPAQLELSYALNNLGSVLEKRDEITAAMDAFRSSLEIKELLVEEQPDNAQWRNDLAGTHSWLGDAYLDAGELRAASEHHAVQLDMLVSLSEEAPDDLHRRNVVGIAHRKVGEIQRLEGRRSEARRHFETSLEIFDGLVRQDPDHQRWHRELAAAYEQLGRLRAGDGSASSGDSLRLLRRGEQIAKEHVVASPDDFENLLQLAAVQIALADLRGRQGNVAEAKMLCSEVIGRLQDLDRHRLQYSPVRWHLGEAFRALGSILALQGEAEEARAAFESSLRQAERLIASSRKPEYRELHARVLLALGRIDEARPIIEDLRESGVMTLALPDDASVDGQPAADHDATAVP